MRRNFHNTQQPPEHQKIYKSFIVNRQKMNMLGGEGQQKNNFDQRCLSPWVDDKKQTIKPDSQSNTNHKFLQKIMFRTKKHSFNPQVQTIKIQPVSNSFRLDSDDYQGIVVFPKSASSRHQQAEQFNSKQDENSIFMKTRGTKFRERTIKQSKVISIDLQMNKQQPKINPEKLFSKSKNLNPYMRNQKKKELLKFKMKHNNRLALFYEKEREQELHKYLKFATEQPKIAAQFTPTRGLKTAKTIWHKRQRQHQSLDLDSMICQGQQMQIKSNHQNRLKRMGIISPDRTVFLY